MSAARLRLQKAFLVLSAAALGIGADAPHSPELQSLGKIELGLWDIRAQDVRDSGRTMCVADPLVLLQLGHPGLACKRYVIANEPQVATVHYTCPGAGNGQTSIRVETPRLIQIETQGIARQTPFQMQFEGRRIGACGRNLR